MTDSPKPKLSYRASALGRFTRCMLKAIYLSRPAASKDDIVREFLGFFSWWRADFAAVQKMQSQRDMVINDTPGLIKSLKDRLDKAIRPSTTKMDYEAVEWPDKSPRLKLYWDYAQEVYSKKIIDRPIVLERIRKIEANEAGSIAEKIEEASTPVDTENAEQDEEIVEAEEVSTEKDGARFAYAGFTVNENFGTLQLKVGSTSLSMAGRAQAHANHKGTIFVLSAGWALHEPLPINSIENAFTKRYRYRLVNGDAREWFDPEMGIDRLTHLFDELMIENDFGYRLKDFKATIYLPKKRY